MPRVRRALFLLVAACVASRAAPLEAQLPVTTQDTIAYFEKLDENRDGVLTGSEAMLCVICSYKDRDGNGVSLAELRGIGTDAAAAARVGSGVLETRADSLAYFEKHDSDRDGFLFGSEKMLCIHCRDGDDTNGDGRISRAEFMAKSAVRAASATPAAPRTPARGGSGPAGAQPAAGFRPGDRVEVQYAHGQWALGVVKAASGAPACPHYTVLQDPHGSGEHEMSYACGSVRAPSAQAKRSPGAEGCGGSRPNCAPKAPPPPGVYTCSETVWQGPGASPAFRSQYRGPITLMAGGRYRMFDNGSVGQYRYDAATHRIHWTGGDMTTRGGTATYGLDGTTPEITVTFETEYSRRTGNEPVRWQCGLSR